jgi:hypothetical protein
MKPQPQTDMNELGHWVIENYAYGHLDQLPGHMLMDLLRDVEACKVFSCWLYQVSKTKTDSIEELASYAAPDVLIRKDVDEAKIRVRLWLIAERMLRMKRLASFDVLIKEMAVRRCEVCWPDGRPVRGQTKIVEVSPGVVTVVGESIDLLLR